MTLPRFLVAVAFAPSAAAQLVSPAGLANQAGNASNNYPFYSTFHYQQIHGDVRGPGQMIRA